MSRPVLLVVDGDREARDLVEQELRDRYGRHYRIESLGSGREARQLLEQLAADGDDVAMVLAGQQLEGSTSGELLEAARRLHPHARRAMLFSWGEQGDAAVGDPIFEAIASGEIDHYARRPSPPPDEFFHNEISG